MRRSALETTSSALAISSGGRPDFTTLLWISLTFSNGGSESFLREARPPPLSAASKNPLKASLTGRSLSL